ncbi:MAG: hypothetical protein A3C93_01350 [Candidatus Lloydbacteria bacterium RIFCSPHIGHO2_02_FULL_54_17]|uniref:DUF5667 domain-containing protein n=1 Tax=Candidatus Lloydbacteria bacterium RIFCSPHIGHO2_02_FULL_54_17 TaxID=1798664 RepID=A0A1G2DGB6_9BACT|nr:MAG: hypothetical protein A2762_00115 [Candidatus Lloydbacteria bacterium RIFCSPHIGHO2_01_FULL_54_11]OGZ12001.1 MAG: hypothetical protein A3C93_01350 [Candidatus Lloydbacteria bacterium RIFCSPHIGHO2_02_FULL_54_17]OGZ14020.1 MAG: hypothetical protein A2948_01005 [Candidatus Lloydbacteria bacterium RIFCSPLOWO2_01_FULL_54_18]
MKKIISHSFFLGLALFILAPISVVSAAEEIDAYCAAPAGAVPHGSTVTLTIKFGDSDKSNALIVQGPFKVLRYDNGKAIIVDAKRGNEKDDKGKENTEKPTLTFSVLLSPKHKLPSPATESVTFTYFVKHKEGKRGELFTTEREQQVDCAFVVQHEVGESTTPSGDNADDDTQKSIGPADLGVPDPGTLPTSRFYFLKEWRRGLTRLFTFNATSRAELELRIMNEKAAEALNVEETKPDDDEALVNALENYTKAQENLRMRLIDLEETSENPRVEKLLEQLNEQTLKHAVLLDQLAQRWVTDPYVEDANVRPSDEQGSTEHGSANVVNPEGARDNHLQGAVDIAQKKIHEVVVAGAEKDKNIEQKAVEQIARAEAMIKELQSELAGFAINEPSVPNARLAIKTKGTSAGIAVDEEGASDQKTGPVRLEPTPARISTNVTTERQTPKRDFGDRMKAGLETAGGMLANGKTFFAEGKFGEAFGQARAAEVLARNISRMLDGVLRADTGGLEDGIKAVAPPMPNVPMPIVPGTGTKGENSVPVVEQRVFPETNNREVACPGDHAIACEVPKTPECRDGVWVCIGPATSAGLITVPEAEVSSSVRVSGYDFVFSGGVFDMTNAPAMTNGVALANITVSVTGPLAFSTQTQSNGIFTLTFRGAPVGNYKVCVTLPSGYTAPSAGDPPCEEVLVETVPDERMLVFTNKGNKAYFTGTGFNFSAIRK